MLEVRLRHRVGPAFGLDLDLASRAGRLGVFGASGAGKTSLLRCLAGIARAGEVRIRCGGTVWQDTSAGVFVPLRERHVGFMSQDPLLFPQYTVEQNLRYSPAGRAAAGRFTDVVEALDLSPLVGRMPRSLSGGEQHRVALGRALLSEPALLLLDEPFAGLDAHNRRAAMALLDRVHRRFGVPWVLVSHAGADLVTLAEEVFVLDAGRVVAQGAPLACMASHSANPLAVAHDVDNLLRGAARPLPDDPALAELAWGDARLIVPAPAAGMPEASYGCYANSLVLSLAEPVRQSARNHLPGRVTGLHAMGTAAVVDVAVGAEQLRALVLERTVEDLALAEGVPVWINVKTTSLDPLG